MPSEELKKNILIEINKTGYPHELKVSNFLQNSGYFVANNLYYIDQDEGKGREVDMRAMKYTEFEKNLKKYFVRQYLLIECKRSRDKPWVIFTSPQTVYDKTFYELDYKGVTSDFRLENEDKVLDKLALIHPPVGNKRLGRSYFEPFKGQEEGGAIFKSLITSVKATIAMRDNEFAAGERNICFYYPLVIFDGKLFEVYLENDNISIEETDMAMISFFYESSKYKQEKFLVPILTEQALEWFFSELDSIHQIFVDFLKENTKWFKELVS